MVIYDFKHDNALLYADSPLSLPFLRTIQLIQFLKITWMMCGSSEFRKQMQEKRYFQNHRKVLVAVSGGLNSDDLVPSICQEQGRTRIELRIVMSTTSNVYRVKYGKKRAAQFCPATW